MDSGGGGRAWTRHVGPPRTLVVQQFAAARSSEVQALYDVLKADAINSGARQSSLTTPRHLRRRTASHNRRRPFRWINNAGQSRKKISGVEPSSSVGQSKAAPASEEDSFLKRKPEKKTPSRRVRRRIELQGVGNGTGSCMRDGTRRLVTHVWHAKRFPMTKAWGYLLPQGLPGSGRGSQAVFKWLKDGAVLHDASYMGLIELQGPTAGFQKFGSYGAHQGSLLRSSLALICNPGPLVYQGPLNLHIGLQFLDVVSRKRRCTDCSMLHNVGKSPYEAIAPVTILWRPSSGGVRGAPERQLWIWVHPSAFDSAFQTLLTACQGQGQDTPQATVRCQSRRGELARLDLLGSRALQVLQKVLRPVPRRFACPSSKDIEGHSGHQDAAANISDPASPEVIQPLSARIFTKADSLPTAAVLALDVFDPRDTPRSLYLVKGANLLEAAQDSVIETNVLSDIQFVSDNSTVEESVIEDGEPLIEKKEEDAGLPCWGNLVEEGLTKEVSDSPYLWLPQVDQKVPALSMKDLSEKRHKRRKAFLSGMDRDVLHNSLEDGALDSMVEQSGVCPVLLLKQTHLRPSASGWSIIMPITWVHAFWVPLIFAGGHVIGLRERHWLATDAGMPYFPHDFPDCPAHAQHLAVDAAAFDSANKLRPPSQRTPCFTVSPLQRSVMHAYRCCTRYSTQSNNGVTSELIVKEHREHYTEANCTMAVPIPKVTSSDCDTAMTEYDTLASRAPSAPLSSHSAEQAIVLEFSNLDEDAAMIGTVPRVTDSAFLQAACHTAGIASGSQFTVPFSDSATTNEVDSQLDGALFSAVASHIVDRGLAPEFTNMEGDTAIGGSGAIIDGPPLLQLASQTADGAGVPQLTNPPGDSAVSAVDSLLDGTRSSALASQIADKGLAPEFTNMELDTAMGGSGAINDGPPWLQVASQIADGEGVLQLTEPAGDSAVSAVDYLPYGTRSSALAPQSADRGLTPELTNIDGDNAVGGSGAIIDGPPFLQTASRIVDEAHVPQFTELLDATSAIDSLVDRALSAAVVSDGADRELSPGFKNMEGDTAMGGSGAISAGLPFLQVASQIVDGASVPQSTKPLGDNATNAIDSLVGGALSSAVGSDGADRRLSPGFKNMEGDIEMGGTGAVIAEPPFLQLACQIADGASVPRFTKLLGDNATNAIDSLVDGALSSAVVSDGVDRGLPPSLEKMEGDTATGGTRAISAEPPVLQAACQIADGASVLQFTKPLGDTAAHAVNSLLDGILSSSVASQRAGGAVVHDLMNMDGDNAMMEIGTPISRPPFSEVAHKTVDGQILFQFTEPPGKSATNEVNSLSGGILFSAVSDPIAIDQYDNERCTSGDNVYSAEAATIGESTSFHTVEVLEIGKNLTTSPVTYKSPVPAQSSPGHTPGLVQHLNTRSSTDPERPTLTFFVVRTMDTLMQVLRENGLGHALVLRSPLINKGGVQYGLSQGRLEWRPSHAPIQSVVCEGSSTIHSSVSKHEKVSHVRVLIVVPRKGVMKENGLLCSPTKEDFLSFLSRSQHWQGVETSWVPKEAKKPKKNEGKREKRQATATPLTVQPSHEVNDFAEGMTDLGHGGYGECCNRETIGCVTSTGPQGSLWSGIGICEVGSLIKLRAMQWADERWWNRREILLLAGNKFSPILRPILVSIALEAGQEQDVM